MFEKSYFLRKFRLFCVLNLCSLRANFVKRFFKNHDVFLVGYPKSGNTWIGFIIANILNGILRKYDTINLKNFTSLIPDVNKQMFYWGKIQNDVGVYGRRFFMTHSPYTSLFEKRKVIYLVRDPRDVVVSYWHYRRLLDERFPLSLDEYARKWLDWPSDWGEHVAGWIDRKNVITLKYEDMKKDTYFFVCEALNFLGFEVDKKLIREAVRNSTFERMKKVEKRWGIKQLKEKTNKESFIRRGIPGGWKKELSGDVVSIIESRYKNLMRRLGYL